MAMLSSIAGLGAVAGPLLGNLFSKVNMQFKLPFGQFILDKFSAPFVISAALTLVVFVLYIFFLQELLNIKVKNTFQLIPKVEVRLLPNWKSLSKTFVLLLSLSFISQLALSMWEGTFALHSQRLFSFGPQRMSLVFIVCGALMGLLQLGPVAWLIEKKGENVLLPLRFSISEYWHIHAYYFNGHEIDFNLRFFFFTGNGNTYTKPGFTYYKRFGKRIWSLTRHL